MLDGGKTSVKTARMFLTQVTSEFSTPKSLAISVTVRDTVKKSKASHVLVANVSHPSHRRQLNICKIYQPMKPARNISHWWESSCRKIAIGFCICVFGGFSDVTRVRK